MMMKSLNGNWLTRCKVMVVGQVCVPPKELPMHFISVQFNSQPYNNMYKKPTSSAVNSLRRLLEPPLVRLIEPPFVVRIRKAR